MGPSSNECETCGKIFSQRSSLNRHRKHTHTAEKSYSYACQQCLMRFSQRSNLLRHIERAHIILSSKTKSFSCSRCCCIFATLNSLKRHERSCYLRRKEVNNIITGQDPEELAKCVVEQLKNLQGSLSVHHELKVDDAVEDRATSIRVVELQDKLHPDRSVHSLYVQTVQRRKCARPSFVCDFCSKEFQKKYDFIRHHRSHTKERPYTCSYCSSRFITKANLSAHQRRHTLNERTGTIQHHHGCPICGETFRSRLQLLRHKACHGSMTISFPSNVDEDYDLIKLQHLIPSPKKVYLTYGVSSEKSTNCSNETRIQFFSCPYCPQLFKGRNSYMRHTKGHLKKLLNKSGYDDTLRAHGDDLTSKYILKSRVNCIHCPKQFNRKSDLLRHIRIHTPHERPYVCCTCNKSFALKGTLKQHQQTHIIRENTISCQCQVCGKLYTTAKSLRVHLRLHTNERHFRCDFCNKTFRTSGHRLSHMRRSAAARQSCKRKIDIYL